MNSSTMTISAEALAAYKRTRKIYYTPMAAIVELISIVAELV